MKKVLVACAVLLFGSISFAAQDNGLSGKLSARTSEKAAAKQCEGCRQKDGQ
ncbi:hypothetical protein Q8A64_08330 [Oxalobacteraceae bacterium R-40]|uniref:Uncharacterized protein n=1 Tax=Keguizhuia sedimenti TaxID=3064264 RepID=A0ABU1BPP1_9BURK|nr:hypothetical protein [Oxalobacteraceae bacterium R-40]